jgi:hypothetical protein
MFSFRESSGRIMKSLNKKRWIRAPSEPPDRSGRGITAVLVQTKDILPMILERIGIPPPEGIQGGAPPDANQPPIAEFYPLPAIKTGGDWRTTYSWPIKFIWNSKGNHLLFDLDEDPRESVNLVERFPKRAIDMQAKLETFLATFTRPGPAGPAREVDAQTRGSR